MAKNVKQRGLGRGLDSLIVETTPVSVVEEKEPKTTKNPNISSKSAGESAGEVIYVGLNDVKPNSNQPRKIFDEEKIQELADSITTHGIIQPLIVRPAKVGYEIVAGERRYRAARKAGLKKIPCIVREFTDKENMLIAIIENMQREDLSAIEEAQGLAEMMDFYGLTQEEVSKSVGKSRPYISNSVRLLELPEEVKTMLANKVITAGHGRALLAIKDQAKIIDLAKKIEKEGLSVRAVERLCAEKSTPRSKARKKTKGADVLSVEQELKDIFGTKVSIEPRGNKGVIEIEYYNDEELNRLIDMLRTAKD